MRHSAGPDAFYFHQVSGLTCKLPEAPGIEAPLSLPLSSPLILYAYAQDGDAIYQHAFAAGRISRMVSENMFRSERCCRLERSIASAAKSAGSRQQEKRSSSQMLTLRP
jgi:hypothetical protein